uniref:Uncharacterized protein n=1 Tax=Arundo donax TaxID=35708 RepID=A0A0A9GS61_ARUDO
MNQVIQSSYTSSVNQPVRASISTNQSSYTSSSTGLNIFF